MADNAETCVMFFDAGEDAMFPNGRDYDAEDY